MRDGVQEGARPADGSHREGRRMRGVTLVPSARRLMVSLRGLPYDLPGAVAGIVDTSLDAGAVTVRVDLATHWRGPFIRISDDGHGMTERRLDEAMRYGSSRQYES